MSRYMKTIIAVLGGIAAWGVTAAADNSISISEMFGLLGALGTALGVYAVPNTPPAGQPRSPLTSETKPQGDLGHTNNSTAMTIALCVLVFVILVLVWGR